MMGCLPSSSTVAQHCDRVNLEICYEAVIVRTSRLQSSKFLDILECLH